MVVSRFDDPTSVEGVSLTCSQIRSLFFMEFNTEGALNSNFFDSGVPINVTKVLEPPTGLSMGSGDGEPGSGSGNIFPGIGGLDDESPVLITQLFPVFSMFSRSDSDPLQP